MRGRAIWIAAALVALLGAVLWLLLGQRSRGPAAPEPSASAAAPSAAALEAQRDPSAAIDPLSGRAPIAGADSAQIAAAPSAIDRERDLHGIVLDPADRPVAGARLSVLRFRSAGTYDFDPDQWSAFERIAETRSDERGEFAIALPPGRPFELHAEAQGYARAVLADRYAGERVIVRLSIGASISGRVLLDQDGSALAGARVRAVCRGSWTTGMSPRSARYEALTDAAGAFAFPGLEPATYDLRAHPPRGASSPQIAVVLADGEAHALEIRIQPGVRVRGSVVDALTRLPIPGAEVSEGLSFERTVRADRNGDFEYDFPAEELLRNIPVWNLSVRAPGYGRAERSIRDPFDGHVAERVDFELSPARGARGWVAGPDGRPVEGARVVALANDRDRLDWKGARSGPDGAFRIEDLRPDARHALVVQSPGLAWAAFEFPADELAVPLVELGRIALAAAGSAAGVVVDDQGRGLSGVLVQLLGCNAERARLGRVDGRLDVYLDGRSARADDLGRFRIEDLPAGEWKLAPWVRGRSGLGSLSFSLGPGERREDLRVLVSAGLPLAGRVVDGGGAGVAGYYVHATLEGGGASRAVARTDAQGSFAMEGLAPGLYELATWPAEDEPDARFAPTTVHGIEAGREDVVIALAPGAELRGIVLGPDGQPYARAVVSASAADGDERDEGWTGEDGRFRLWVAAGELYLLEARPTREIEGKEGRRIDPDPAHGVRLEGQSPGPAEIVMRLPATE